MAIDWKSFARDVREERARQGIGVRAAAKAATVSPATFSRAENENPMSAELFMVMCWWLEVEPTDYRTI